ncbi:MAG: hypothetical protein M3352_00720 [Bacteroidota bacterium]|nr:hypothetical protein [Bacteroidota bacterium]
MPDLISIIERWWKLIAGLTIVNSILAFVLLLFVPKKYLSIATALPASSVSADKSRIFNTNVQELYSSLGSPDDLDKIIGTANLDTLYIALVKEYNLRNGFNYELTAALALKKNVNVIKSQYGELKIKVWNKNSKLAAALANGLLQKLQQLHQTLQNQNNALTLQKLQETYVTMQNNYITSDDSSGSTDPRKTTVLSIKNKNLQEQLNQYEKLIAEYQLVLNTNPPALFVVEQARASAKPDKPKIWQSVLLTAFVSVVFGSLLAFFLQSRGRYESHN